MRVGRLRLAFRLGLLAWPQGPPGPCPRPLGETSVVLPHRRLSARTRGWLALQVRDLQGHFLNDPRTAKLIFNDARLTVNMMTGWVSSPSPSLSPSLSTYMYIYMVPPPLTDHALSTES